MHGVLENGKGREQFIFIKKKEDNYRIFAAMTCLMIYENEQ